MGYTKKVIISTVVFLVAIFVICFVYIYHGFGFKYQGQNLRYVSGSYNDFLMKDQDDSLLHYKFVSTETGDDIKLTYKEQQIHYVYDMNAYPSRQTVFSDGSIVEGYMGEDSYGNPNASQTISQKLDKELFRAVRSVSAYNKTFFAVGFYEESGVYVLFLTIGILMFFIPGWFRREDESEAKFPVVPTIVMSVLMIPTSIITIMFSGLILPYPLIILTIVDCYRSQTNHRIRFVVSTIILKLLGIGHVVLCCYGMYELVF